MADQAKVSSLDAIEAFRTSLVIFIEKAGKALDEVGDAVRRTRYWVQDEQRNHWLAERRRRERKLEQAEQELYSSRLSPLEDSGTEAQMLVRRARRALQEADEKLRVIKRWTRDYDSAVEPLARRLDTIQDLVATKYPKATAELAETLRILEDYAAVKPSSPTPPESGTDAS